MLEHRGAQHRVDTHAGVEQQGLPDPAQGRRKEHEHAQTHAERDQGGLRSMDDHLVDDGLCEQRRSQGQQLDDERGGQHVAPETAVLEQLGHEPAEAELLRCGGCVRIMWLIDSRAHQEQRAAAGLVERHSSHDLRFAHA
jgi:hypothetical protein